MTQNRNKHSNWLEQMAEAEAECGGIVTGRLGSPDDHPIEPVAEDEASLRKILAEKFNQMLQKEAAREKYSRENAPPPNAVFPRGIMLDDSYLVAK